MIQWYSCLARASDRFGRLSCKTSDAEIVVFAHKPNNLVTARVGVRVAGVVLPFVGCDINVNALLGLSAIWRRTYMPS